MKRNCVAIALGCILAAPAAQPVLAQGARVVTMVVPLAAGGGTDLFARALAKDLGDASGQTYVVENRAGAAGMIGARHVSRAAPDGQTLLFTTNLVTINQSLMKNPDFDVRKDLAAVSQVAIGLYAFLVNASLPIRNIREFVEYAKANPGKMNYGSSGIGSSAHLVPAYFDWVAGTRSVHVPFNGNAPAFTALLANNIQILWNDAALSLEAMRKGQVRMIAVGAERRSPLVPDVPTVAESGYPGFEAAFKFGIYAPPATSRAELERLSAQVAGVLKSPALRKRFEDAGYQVVGNRPDEFARQTAEEVDKWAKVIKAAGIEPN